MHPATRAETRAEPHTRGRAVVVDDDPDQRALLAHVLGKAGFDVSTLRDGIELLDVLRMTPPRHFRIVVSDQRMPGLHGLEVLARSVARRTPFVIVTGYDTPELREQAAKYGASAFVRKPLDLADFLAVVDRVLDEDAKRDGVQG
jgi:DNA-binding NtrC family response regulator